MEIVSLSNESIGGNDVSARVKWEASSVEANNAIVLCMGVVIHFLCLFFVKEIITWILSSVIMFCFSFLFSPLRVVWERMRLPVMKFSNVEVKWT